MSIEVYDLGAEARKAMRFLLDEGMRCGRVGCGAVATMVFDGGTGPMFACAACVHEPLAFGVFIVDMATGRQVRPGGELCDCEDCNDRAAAAS